MLTRGKELADQPEEGVAQEQQEQDGRAADDQDQPRQVAALADLQEAHPQQHGHHQIVGDHRAQRHRGDDDHGRARRQAAQIGHQRQPFVARCHRQQEDVEVAVADAAQDAGQGDRQHEQVDRQEVAGQQPARLAQMGLVEVLDHRHLELAVEEQEGQAGQGGDQEPVGMSGAAALHGERRAVRQVRGLPQHIAEAVEHDIGDVDADDQEGGELDHALEGDRQHHALVMLGGVDVPGAEQDAEQRDQQEHEQGRLRTAAGVAGAADQGGDAGGDRLELERDVGDGAGDRDHGDEARQHGALAVAGGDEVGDRGDALRLGDAQHLLDQKAEQQCRQGGAEIDRQEIQPLARGETDAAVEGPGGAVDAQGQRVDIGAADDAAALVRPLVAERGDREQHAEIEQRDQQDDAGIEHQPRFPGRAASAAVSRIRPSQATNR